MDHTVGIVRAAKMKRMAMSLERFGMRVLRKFMRQSESLFARLSMSNPFMTHTGKVVRIKAKHAIDARTRSSRLHPKPRVT